MEHGCNAVKAESTGAFNQTSQLDEICNKLTVIEGQLAKIQETQKIISQKIMLDIFESQCQDAFYLKTVEQFHRSYKIELPCKSIEEFLQLNKMLEENEAYNNDLTDLLRHNTDSTGGIGKTASQILKQCVTRQVAAQITTQRERSNKHVLKLMPIYNIFSNVLTYVYNDLSEKTVLLAIGKALSNSKDWGSHRRRRNKRRDEEDDESSDENSRGEI